MTGGDGHASERGSIAILALWGVSLIFVLLAAANYTIRGELTIARNEIAASRARLAAEAGTQLGLARLLRRRAAGTALFEGAAERWRDGGARVAITILDEAGKIDLNVAPLAFLAGLFEAVGRPKEEALLLACNVIDRRGDAAPLCPEPGGSGHRGRRFAAPEEVAQLPGIDDLLYDQIADSVTVATAAAAIDPLVAGRTALLAVPGATPALVDAFLSGRALWRDTAKGGTAPGLPPGTPFLMVTPARDFTIKAVATTPDGARARADLQVRLTGIANQPYEVMAWRTPPPSRGARPAAPAARVP